MYNQYHGPAPKPGPQPSPEPHLVPSPSPGSEPDQNAIASHFSGTSTMHQAEVDGGEVVDKVVADENGAATVDSGSDHRKADPETDGGPEYRWSCMEGHAYGSPHALASHYGKAKRKEGDHNPLGMVDTTTGQVVWKWSTTKEAYGLYKRIRAGETLAQAIAGTVTSRGGGYTTPGRNETPTSTTTRTIPTTWPPQSTSPSEIVGTPGPEARSLGGVLRPKLLWLDPRLGAYYDMVKDGIASQGKNYTDSFSQFIYNAVVGFLIEHGTELGLGPNFGSKAQKRVQSR